jgi:hypothetical protein
MLAGDDRLFVDLFNGSPLPTGGIDFAGGTNGATGDSLMVLGDDLATGSYAADASTTGDGVVTLNGRQIDLTGVEPIRVSDLVSFAVTTPNPDDTLTIAGIGSGIDRLAGTSGAVTLSPVTFSDVDIFIIDAAVNDGGAGDDSLSISSTGQVPASLGFIQYMTGTGANTLDIEDGTARVDATMATGGTLDTTIDDGAELFTHRLRQTSLTIGNGSLATVVPLSGTEVSVLDTLTIAGAMDAWTGRLDLNTSDLIVQSTPSEKAAEFATLYNQLRQGFNGGAWLGNGIHSLAAATNPNVDTGLALVDNGIFSYPTFTGQPVDDNSLLIKYTYYGDIDVNGQVDADDLTVFANNFGVVTSGATQVDGDIDFDGDVDADDLTVFANNFGKGIGSPLSAGGAEPLAAAAPVAVQAVETAADSAMDDDLIAAIAQSVAEEESANRKRKSSALDQVFANLFN